MSTATGIEWTDMTWNPVVGCSRVSAGCDHCYAIRQVHRMGSNPNAKVKAANAELTRYKERGLDWSGQVRVLPDRLELPLKLRKPQRIFVNSLSDLFHEQVPDEFIDQVFAVMALCPQHTFQVLTKRPERMLRYCLSRTDMVGPAFNLLVSLGHLSLSDSAVGVGFSATQWPLPNCWFGISVEDQDTADERIPLLLQTPAEVRFLSCEPLLSALALKREWFYRNNERQCRNRDLALHHKIHLCPECGPRTGCGLDWVIVGGESGPGARPMPPDWVRSIRDQCQAAGVPFFFKQWGEWQKTDAIPGGDLEGDMRRGLVELVELNREPDGHFRRGDVLMRRVGKKAAGRLLDGREWNER